MAHPRRPCQFKNHRAAVTGLHTILRKIVLEGLLVSDVFEFLLHSLLFHGDGLNRYAIDIGQQVCNTSDKESA